MTAGVVETEGQRDEEGDGRKVKKGKGNRNRRRRGCWAGEDKQ